MKVKLEVIDGRTYIDVVDLIRALSKMGNQVVTKDLIDILWTLDEKGQSHKRG